MISWAFSYPGSKLVGMALIAATAAGFSQLSPLASQAAAEPLVMKIVVTADNPWFRVPVDVDPEDGPACFVDWVVDWGDGTAPETVYSAGSDLPSGRSPLHTYTSFGEKTVSVTIGPDHTCQLGSSRNKEPLTQVVSWGGRSESGDWITSLAFAFEGALNLISVPDSLPTSVQDISYAFSEAENFNQDLSTWNVSNVRYMNATFAGAISFNQNLNSWDTSSVLEMRSMFESAESFDQDLESWDVSNVTTLKSMFASAYEFNGDISGWDVSSVTDMTWMFSDAEVFNQNIAGWDTSSLTSLKGTFSGARAFNQDIGGWDTSSVTLMESTFSVAESFNQDISRWDTAEVTDMTDMFSYADVFNQDINGWDTAKVTSMQAMFQDAYAFNQDLSSWDTGQVTTFNNMFRNASVFNGEIGNWDTTLVTDMGGMFYAAAEFNQDISSWNTGAVQDMSDMFGEAVKFNQPIGGWDIGLVDAFDGFLEASGPTDFGYCLPWAGNDDFDYRLVNGGLFAPGYDQNNCIDVTFDTQGGDDYAGFSYQATGFTVPEPEGATKTDDTFVGWSASPASCDLATFPFDQALTSPTTTFYAVWESVCPQGEAAEVSIAAPYRGPVVKQIGDSTGPQAAAPGSEVIIQLENGSSITQILIGGLEAEYDFGVDGSVTVNIPMGLDPGLVDLILIGDHGRLTVQGALQILPALERAEKAVSECKDVTATAWTKRTSSKEAKLYVRCAEPGVSYRVLVQNPQTLTYEPLITRTPVDELDPRQVFTESGRYFIRTIPISDRVRLRVLAGDEVIWRVVYNESSWSQ